MKMFSHIKLTKELTLLLFTFGITILLYFALPDYYYGALHVQAQLQQQRQQPPLIMGIKITSPVTNQVPVGPLTISGISTDNATSDCTVYADWNNTKPFQKAIATGAGGANDYSNWTFTYTDKYHLITNGTNELTSKLSCVSSPANLTKWNSLNVIGLESNQNQNQTQPSPIKINSTTLGNGTILGNSTSNTAALGVGAENGDSSDLLPRPIVTEQKQNNLSGSSRISTSPLSPVKGDNNDNNGTKTGTRTTIGSESIPSVPITPSPDPSSSPFTQKQQEEEPQPELEPQPEDNYDTTLYWDMEEEQDSGNDNEQVFDFEGNIFD